jgi:poly(A) polymerase
MLDRLEGPERQATGAVKEAVFNDPDLPEDRDEALAYLDRVKDDLLSSDPATGEEESDEETG